MTDNRYVIIYEDYDAFGIEDNVDTNRHLKSLEEVVDELNSLNNQNERLKKRVAFFKALAEGVYQFIRETLEYSLITFEEGSFDEE